MRSYFDHNATTPLHPEVVEAFGRAGAELYGNPSSVHAEGAAARAELERARQRVAALLHGAPEELVFTAGASEANNSVLAGRVGPGQHVVASCLEHPSVEEPLRALEAAGVAVTRVPVDPGGRLDPADFAAAFRPETALACVIWAHNETGVIQPVEALAREARERGVPLHLDATQALGKLPVDVSALGADTLAASAHKCNGPKGIGVLWQRRGSAALAPLVRGGPQERRRRGGTENLLGALGFGVAAACAAREGEEHARRLAPLRDRLWEGIAAKVPRVRRNGDPRHVLPNTLNVEFEASAGDVLVAALDLEGVACSTGAACSSGSIEPSAALLAMGLSPARARGSLRFSLGRSNDEADVERLLALLPDVVARVRASVAP